MRAIYKTKQVGDMIRAFVPARNSSVTSLWRQRGGHRAGPPVRM